ncbi:MAG: hypothetical protein E7F15_13500 [Clostridiales bacterium]|nr:hypothetical protein [Clostridiales bacterium]
MREAVILLGGDFGDIMAVISYVVTVVRAEEELYSIGQVAGSVAQVFMSIVYIFLEKKYKANCIVNLGAILMMCAFFMLVFHLQPVCYLVFMVVLGAALVVAPTCIVQLKRRERIKTSSESKI